MKRPAQKYAEGQTWSSATGASRTILALYPETERADASVRFANENGDERTVGLSGFKSWVSITRAVVS